MRTSATKDILHGPKTYTDYDRAWGNRRQLLVSDQAANILSNFLAVFLALAAKGLFSVLIRGLKVFFEWLEKSSASAPASDEQGLELNLLMLAALPYYSHAQEVASAAGPSPSQPENGMLRRGHQSTGEDTNDHEASSAPYSGVLEIVEQAKDVEGLVIGSLRSLLSQLRGVVPLRRFGEEQAQFRVFTIHFWVASVRLIRDNSTDLTWTVFMVFLSTIFYIGSLLVGIMCTYPVISDSVALSRSSHCGIILSPGPEDVDASGFAIWQKYYHDIALESQQYARTCYDAGDGADGCSFFYEQSIRYVAEDNDVCPFKDHSTALCFNMSTSAYTLNTGLVDAKVIGVNSPLRYTFQRSLTCSPLRMDDGYIRAFVKDDELKFRYFYGGRSGDSNCSSNLPNCTFELPVYRSDVQPYSLFADSTQNIANSSWRPLFDIDQNNGEKATIILISNYGVSYPTKRLDPIFTANTTYDGRWYYNTNWHAGVLGCIDRTIVCTPNQSSCMSLRALGAIPNSGNEDSYMRAMLYFSLLTSSIDSSLGYLRTQALDAQSKLVGTSSLPLADEQWKVEIQKLFEASLARTQITARNLARGNPEGSFPGQKDLMDPRWKGLCSRYKFRSVGYKNISVSRFFGFFFAGLIFIVLSISAGSEDDELWVVKQIKRARRPQVRKKLFEMSKATCNVVLSVPGKTWHSTRDIGYLCWDRTGEVFGDVSRLWRNV